MAIGLHRAKTGACPESAPPKPAASRRSAATMRIAGRGRSWVDSRAELEQASDGMGVFISWAIEGSLSHQMALQIKEWLPDVFFGQVECFVSSTDISAGSVWLQELFGQLERSQAGVVCLTRESMTRGWMLFEAGALAKMIGTQTQRVCPLLLDLDPGELEYPLAAFQWKVIRPDAEEVSKAQVLALVKTVNESIDESSKQLPEHRLLAQFAAFWPRFWRAYTDVRAAQNNPATHAPVQIGNNEILVEMRSGFRQMLNMLEREQRIEVQVVCPNCRAAVVGEFYNAVGATRHFTCSKCCARFISHLDSDRTAQTKLLAGGPRTSLTSAPVIASGSEALQVSCPSCGDVQVEAFVVVPGSTRHLTCLHCGERFVAHRMLDGTSKSRPVPVGASPRTPFEGFLRKTSFWVNPDKVEPLISMACEADSALHQARQTKTPTLLKKAILEKQPREASVVVNTVVKVLLHGGAFTLVPEPHQSPFYQTYANRLEHVDLLRAFYRGQVRRLRAQFRDLGANDFQDVSSVLETASILGADAALMEALQAAVGSREAPQPVVTQAAPIPPGMKEDENLLDSTAPVADSPREG